MPAPLIQHILRETLLCAARQIPVLGTAAEIWAGVEAQRTQLAQAEALKDVEARLSHFERAQRDLIERVITDLLADLRAKRPDPHRLTASLRELHAMQSQGYMVGLFQGLLEAGDAWPTLRASPQVFGLLLAPDEAPRPGMIPLFLELDGAPRVLQAPLSSLGPLLQCRARGEARRLGGGVWGVKRQGGLLGWWRQRAATSATPSVMRSAAPRPTPPSPPIDLPPEEAVAVSALWCHAAYRPQQDLAWGLMRLVPDERLIEAHPELRVSVHHVLILDLSGSMNEPDKYPRLLEAVAHYQAALDEADRLTLIPFSAYATTLTSGAVVGDLRDAGADMISTLESWPGRFQMTRLAPALDQAVRAIDATRAAGFEGAARLLCMTDGMIDDPFECRFGLAGIFQREARVDLLGFGHGFAIDQAEALLDRHPLSKIRYVEAGEGHISEYFAHLARTSQRIVLQGARLEVVIDEAVSCLEVFAARPNERFIGDLSDEAAARVEIPIGAMEARKAYLFLFHLRAWTSVEVAARLTLHATLRGAPFTLTSSLKIPLGEALGAPNGFVLDMAASLKHLAEPEGVDEIEATEARLRLYQLERRGARYVEALEHKLRVLKGEIVAPPAPPQDMRLYAEADAATCTGVFGVPSNGAPL